MTACGYCDQRKGKRTCPAIAGQICSRCCGQHRLVAIDCPADCPHLGGLGITRDPERAREIRFSKADYIAAFDKLRAFGDDTDTLRELAARIETWDPSIAIAYVYYGHRSPGGERLIERFIAARARGLPAPEAAACVALQQARASLFEITAIVTGVGLTLRDLLSGETLEVQELTGSARMGRHDVLFAWVMRVADHHELSGAAVRVASADVEGVRGALQRELAVAREQWPMIAEADLVGSIAWVLFEVRQPPALESTREVAAVPAAAEAQASIESTYDAHVAPDPEVWLAIEEATRIAAVEAYHRAHAIDLPNPELHATLHTIVENQVAANAPPEARATLERLVAGGVSRHEAVHAVGSVVAHAIWDVKRRAALVDHEALIAALARLDPRDWSGDAGDACDAESTAIPPLAHELLYRHVSGLREAIERGARHMRQHGWTETTVADPLGLIEQSTLGLFVKAYAAGLVAAGWRREAAIDDGNLLSVHAVSYLSHELHRKKTFWVDESLAFMLGCTRLDVRGEGFRLPFPAFAMVFTDRETLGLAEAVARTDPEASVSGLPLRGLTVYAMQVPAVSGALGLHLAFLLDAATDTWPWLITRDLDIRPDDTLDQIIESRFADARDPDPVFRSAELRQLVQLVINAVLYAGSSPVWPVIGAPEPAAAATPPRHSRGRAAPLPAQTEERVWHLPGKIPIRQVRALRQLQRARDGGALFARFMVRGHWRRAPDHWADRNPRWIAPYWKGPPLGDIVERDYALKP